VRESADDLSSLDLFGRLALFGKLYGCGKIFRAVFRPVGNVRSAGIADRTGSEQPVKIRVVFLDGDQTVGSQDDGTVE